MVTPEAINAMLAEAWPVARVRCTAVDATSAEAALDIIEDDVRPGAIISGPSQFAIADAALWFLVHGAAGQILPMAVTSELSLRFLRPATGERMYARAELERMGSRTLVGSVRIWAQNGPEAPSAIGQATYALPRRN